MKFHAKIKRPCYIQMRIITRQCHFYISKFRSPDNVGNIKVTDHRSTMNNLMLKNVPLHTNINQDRSTGHCVCMCVCYKAIVISFSSAIYLRVLLACQLSINLINIPAILYCYLSKMKEEADIVLTASIRFINFFFI